MGKFDLNQITQILKKVGTEVVETVKNKNFKERQDRLLAYDAELKKELQKLDEENQEFKVQIRELEKKKAKE